MLSHKFHHIPFLRTDDIYTWLGPNITGYLLLAITNYSLSSVITISSPVANQAFVVSVLCPLFLNNNLLNCSFYSQQVIEPLLCPSGATARVILFPTNSTSSLTPACCNVLSYSHRLYLALRPRSPIRGCILHFFLSLSICPRSAIPGV